MRRRIHDFQCLLTSIPADGLAQISVRRSSSTRRSLPTSYGDHRIIQLYKTATQTYNQIAYSAHWFTNKTGGWYRNSSRE